MAKDPGKLAGRFDTDNTGGVLSGFLAEEDVFDRRALWRLGSWGVASVGAVVLAVYANQSSIAVHREQAAVSAALTVLRPRPPRRFTGAPELLEVVAVAQRVHRLPEAVVAI